MTTFQFARLDEVEEFNEATEQALALKADAAATTAALALKADDNAVVKLTGNQTVAGVKTFSSIPVGPASDPTTDNQFARKAYVDAQVAGAGGGGTVVAAVTDFTVQAVSQTEVFLVNETLDLNDGDTIDLEIEGRVFNDLLVAPDYDFLLDLGGLMGGSAVVTQTEGETGFFKIRATMRLNSGAASSLLFALQYEDQSAGVTVSRMGEDMQTEDFFSAPIQLVATLASATNDTTQTVTVYGYTLHVTPAT